LKQSWRESKSAFLAVLLVVTILLVGLHYRARRNGRASAPEQVVYFILRPFQISFSRFGGRVTDRWESLRRLQTLENENRILRQRVERLDAKNKRLRIYEKENKRLRALLKLGPSEPPERIAAEIISQSASNWLHRVRINRGAIDGVAPKSVVFTDKGVVGQVLTVSRSTSLVLLITDPDAGVGGMLQRSRAVGAVKGTGGDLCEMTYLGAKVDVREGDTVITSHLGEVFPKGITIGQVVSVRKARHYSSLEALIQPAVDMYRLEEVFVLNKGQ